MQINQFWATLLATAAGAPVTFVIIKLFAFDNKAKAEKDEE